jgi:hypothetical protein
MGEPGSRDSKVQKRNRKWYYTAKVRLMRQRPTPYPNSQSHVYRKARTVGSSARLSCTRAWRRLPLCDSRSAYRDSCVSFRHSLSVTLSLSLSLSLHLCCLTVLADRIVLRNHASWRHGTCIHMHARIHVPCQPSAVLCGLCPSPSQGAIPRKGRTMPIRGVLCALTKALRGPP